MPNQNVPELTPAQQQQLLTIADQNRVSDPAHLLVETMSNPQVQQNSNEGRDNFSPEAIKQLKGRGHNYSDTRTLEQQLGELHPSRSKAEDLDRLNDQLGNTIVIDTAIDGRNGGWTTNW